MATERDPLLAPPSGLAEPGAPEEVADTELFSVTRPSTWFTKRRSKLGPMELTRSHRWAILAGIWTATFLSVSFVCYCLFGLLNEF